MRFVASLEHDEITGGSVNTSEHFGPHVLGQCSRANNAEKHGTTPHSTPDWVFRTLNVLESHLYPSPLVVFEASDGFCGDQRNEGLEVWRANVVKRQDGFEGANGKARNSPDQNLDRRHQGIRQEKQHPCVGFSWLVREHIQTIRRIDLFRPSIGQSLHKYGEHIVATLSKQLSWSHFVEILALDDPLKRGFYAEMCRIERWSVRVLRKKIESMLFERTAPSKKPDKFIRMELDALRTEDKLTPDLVFRDPYFLDFLGLRDDEDEPIGIILCAGKKDETVRLMDLGRRGIQVASYLTDMLPKEDLERKLHEAVRLARAKLAEQREHPSSVPRPIAPGKPAFHQQWKRARRN